MEKEQDHAEILRLVVINAIKECVPSLVFSLMGVSQRLWSHVFYAAYNELRSRIERKDDSHNATKLLPLAEQFKFLFTLAFPCRARDLQETVVPPHVNLPGLGRVAKADWIDGSEFFLFFEDSRMTLTVCAYFGMVNDFHSNLVLAHDLSWLVGKSLSDIVVLPPDLQPKTFKRHNDVTGGWIEMPLYSPFTMSGDYDAYDEMERRYCFVCDDGVQFPVTLTHLASSNDELNIQMVTGLIDIL